MTVLLEYLDCSISVAGQQRFGGPRPALAYTTERDIAFEEFAKFKDMLLYNMLIMPALCSQLAYYAGIMLNTLAYLLCLKLCQHNQHRPKAG